MDRAKKTAIRVQKRLIYGFGVAYIRGLKAVRLHSVPFLITFADPNAQSGYYFCGNKYRGPAKASLLVWSIAINLIRVLTL